MNAINTGDTAFMLVAAALVLFMTPGLAFCYGGLVRSKNVVNTMMMVGVLATAAFAAATTVLLIKLLDVTIGIRTDHEEEHEGLDLTEHGEKAYHELF